MTCQKKYLLIKLTAFPVLCLYFFIAVACLFLAPGFQYNSARNTKRISTNTQVIYNLIRTSRCVAANSNQAGKIFAKYSHSSYIQLLPGPGFLNAVQNRHNLFSDFLPDRHLSYLFYCVIRI
jgi:hypothetical protein